ncbi:MAG: hypothetical protein ABWZ02_10110 [Nakamurella sp.]
MPLVQPTPPAAATAAIRDKLEQYGDPEITNPAALGGSQPTELTPVSALPTYVLGLDALGRAYPLDSARAIGWRYLLEDGGQAVAAAETVRSDEGGHRFASFNKGPFVSATVAAMHAAQLHATGQDLEVRFLTVPAIALRALWLHPTTPASPTLIPLAPAPSGVEAFHPYPAAELFTIVAEAAAQVNDVGINDDRGS